MRPIKVGDTPQPVRLISHTVIGLAWDLGLTADDGRRMPSL